MNKPICIYGIPVFEIPMSLKEAKQLQEIARSHYDGVCKEAAELGGFIYGWINALSPPGKVEYVRATWRDADLVLKICEMPCPIELVQLSIRIRGAMTKASKISENWQSEND